LFSKVENQSSN